MTLRPTDPAVDALWFMNDLARIHLRGGQVGGRVSIVEFTSPPGTMPPLHRHDREDELFYVVEGHLALHQPGRRSEGETGSALFAERASRTRTRCSGTLRRDSSSSRPPLASRTSCPRSLAAPTVCDGRTRASPIPRRWRPWLPDTASSCSGHPEPCRDPRRCGARPLRWPHVRCTGQAVTEQASDPSAPVPTDALVEDLLRERDALLALLANVEPGSMTTPGLVGEWSARELIAHLGFWAGHAVESIHAVEGGRAEHFGADRPTVDEVNATVARVARSTGLATVRKREAASVEALVLRLRAMERSLLDTFLRHHGITLEQGIREDGSDHYREHAEQLRGVLEAPARG